MLKSLEGARLGIFIFLGTVLFVLAVFLVGNKESLFVGTYTIKTRISTVEGLKTGAPVRLSGLDIGSVSAIRLVEDSLGIVEVEMRIEEGVDHLIRLNSIAAVGTEGLVGKKIIQISPGTEGFNKVENGGYIKSKDPVNIAEIIEQTEATIGYVKVITKDFSEIVQKVNQGEGTIGQLINNDELYRSAVQITESADFSLNEITLRFGEITDFIIASGKNVEGILANVDSVALVIQKLIGTIERGEGTIGALMKDRTPLDSVQVIISNLSKTTALAIEGAESFAENMEALKHNWLFKNYFEERGYWDRSEYSDSLDAKLNEINLQNEKLQRRIEMLQDLEKKASERES